MLSLILYESDAGNCLMWNIEKEKIKKICLNFCNNLISPTSPTQFCHAQHASGSFYLLFLLQTTKMEFFFLCFVHMCITIQYSVGVECLSMLFTSNSKQNKQEIDKSTICYTKNSLGKLSVSSCKYYQYYFFHGWCLNMLWLCIYTLGGINKKLPLPHNQLLSYSHSL